MGNVQGRQIEWGHPMSIVDELRRKIDAEHEEAIKALDKLAAYLNRTGANGTLPATASVSGTRRRKTRTGSIRERVFAVIGSRWATVEMLVEQTGLDIRQVRGVLNAPALIGKIEKRDAGDGKKEYRLPGGE
jgi:hypothetical protein